MDRLILIYHVLYKLNRCMSHEVANIRKQQKLRQTGKDSMGKHRPGFIIIIMPKISTAK